jgi:hypothetical protein
MLISRQKKCRVAISVRKPNFHAKILPVKLAGPGQIHERVM